MAKKRTTLTDARIDEYRKLVGLGYTRVQIAAEMGIKRGTVYRLGVISGARAPRGRRYFHRSVLTRVIAMIFNHPHLSDREIAFENNCNDAFVEQTRAWMAQEGIRK